MQQSPALRLKKSGTSGRADSGAVDDPFDFLDQQRMFDDGCPNHPKSQTEPSLDAAAG